MTGNPDNISSWRSQLLRGRDVARLVELLSDCEPPEQGSHGDIATIIANQQEILANQQEIIANQQKILANQELIIAK